MFLLGLFTDLEWSILMGFQYKGRNHNVNSVSRDKLSMHEYMIMSNIQKDFTGNHLQFYVLFKIEI